MFLALSYCQSGLELAPRREAPKHEKTMNPKHYELLYQRAVQLMAGVNLTAEEAEKLIFLIRTRIRPRSKPWPRQGDQEDQAGDKD